MSLDFLVARFSCKTLWRKVVKANNFTLFPVGFGRKYRVFRNACEVFKRKIDFGSSVVSGTWYRIFPKKEVFNCFLNGGTDFNLQSFVIFFENQEFVSVFVKWWQFLTFFEISRDDLWFLRQLGDQKFSKISLGFKNSWKIFGESKLF